MASSDAVDVTNRLISCLPRKDQRQLYAEAEQVELAAGDVLCEVGALVEHVYFPLTGYISLVTTIDRHFGLEVGLIGNEGMFGVPVVLGAGCSLQQALVQGTGLALRLKAATLRRLMRSSRALPQRLGRYAHVQTSQFAQIAACTRFHLLGERLARWLLLTHDRAHADQFDVTQQFLGNMLSARREGVSAAAGRLRARKLIGFSRGRITVLDRAGLESAACACYRASVQTYDQIMR